MQITKAILAQFYDLFFIQELPKNDIIVAMKITEPQYRNILKTAKKRQITEINTETLEGLIVQKLNLNPDLDTIKMATEIWKWKSRVKDTPKKQTDLDLSELIDDSGSVSS